MKPFIITGCARSGMAYTAKLLTAAGVPCTHEEVFSLEATRELTGGPPGLDDQVIKYALLCSLKWKGESSWLAAPLLGKLPEGIIIFHQLRNPLHVIRSLMRRRFFHADRRTGSEYTGYAKRWMAREPAPPPWSNIAENDPPILQCMKYWVRWNLLASFHVEDTENARVFSYRVEDLSAGQLTLPEMLKMITGSLVPSSTDFFGQVPARLAEADAISWEDLPEGRTKRHLERMASTWGYGEEDLV